MVYLTYMSATTSCLSTILTMSQIERLATAYLLNYTTIHLSYFLFPTVWGVVLEHTRVAKAVSIRSETYYSRERSDNILEILFDVFMSDWDMHCLCRMSRVVWKIDRPQQSNHFHELQRHLSKQKYKRLNAMRRATPDDSLNDSRTMQESCKSHPERSNREIRCGYATRQELLA